MRSSNLDRRALLRGAALGGAGLSLANWFPAWAQPVSAGIARPLPMVSGTDIALRIAHQMMTIDGRANHAIGVNGTVPAPLIRLKQGTTIRLSVTNDLDQDRSNHWHGPLVPAPVHGVPRARFPGLRP